MTEADDRMEAVRSLLSETEAAHGVYETTELDGVYDQGWPSWYADYAVEHGLGDLLGQAVTPDALAEFLASALTDFKENDSQPTEGWAEYTARRITTEL